MFVINKNGMIDYYFIQADISEIPTIWEIIQHAIKRRKEDGSDQWQDGYPNFKIIQKDIKKGDGYILTDGKTIIGYCAILINNESSYNDIVGKWLTDGDYVVFHRIAISENFLKKGFAKKIIQFIEEFALKHNVYSIKADTNFDNLAMIKIFEQMNYIFCGEIYFRGSSRKAYEKVLSKIS